MAFPENFISELIERNDIVSVVSDYVTHTLSPSGQEELLVLQTDWLKEFQITLL